MVLARGTGEVLHHGKDGNTNDAAGRNTYHENCSDVAKRTCPEGSGDGEPQGDRAGRGGDSLDKHKEEDAGVALCSSLMHDEKWGHASGSFSGARSNCLAPPATLMIRLPRVMAYGPHSREIVLVCMLSFLKWFKPSEAYLVEFMEGKGFSSHDVFQHVFPIWVYSQLPCLLLVALLSKSIGCKPVVILGTLFGLATTGLTLWAPQGQLPWLQFSQVSFALSFASHSSLSALLLASVPRPLFPIASHGSRASALAGTFLSALLGSALRPHLPLSTLFCISLASQLACVLLSLLLCSHLLQKDGRHEEATCAATSNEHNSWRCKLGMEGIYPIISSPSSTSSTSFSSKSFEGKCAGLALGVRYAVWGAEMVLSGAWMDVRMAMAVPLVRSWTGWAVVSSAVHMLTMTYWQSLVEAVRHGERALVGSMVAAGRGERGREVGVGSGAIGGVQNGHGRARYGNGWCYVAMNLGATLATALTARNSLMSVQGLFQVLSPTLCGCALLVAAAGPLPATYTSLVVYHILHEITGALCATLVGDQLHRLHQLSAEEPSSRMEASSTHPPSSPPSYRPPHSPTLISEASSCGQPLGQHNLTSSDGSAAIVGPLDRSLAIVFAATSSAGIMVEVALQAILHLSSSPVRMWFFSMSALLLLLPLACNSCMPSSTLFFLLPSTWLGSSKETGSCNGCSEVKYGKESRVQQTFLCSTAASESDESSIATPLMP